MSAPDIRKDLETDIRDLVDSMRVDAEAVVTNITYIQKALHTLAILLQELETANNF